MSVEVSQKGDFYFVEHVGRVIGRFKIKEEAQAFAKQREHEMEDYYKNTRTNITYNSDQDLQARV